MKSRVMIERLSFGSVYKLVGLGLVASFLPFSIFMGTLAFFGSGTVTWNEQPLTGISGLVAAPFIGLFVAAIFTILLGTMISVGLWIVSRFRSIEISIYKLEDTTDF